MARGYLNALSVIDSEDGVVRREITWSEALAFHNRVFSEMGLPEESWTLWNAIRDRFIYL